MFVKGQSPLKAPNPNGWSKYKPNPNRSPKRSKLSFIEGFQEIEPIEVAEHEGERFVAEQSNAQNSAN